MKEESIAELTAIPRMLSGLVRSLEKSE